MGFIQWTMADTLLGQNRKIDQYDFNRDLDVNITNTDQTVNIIQCPVCNNSLNPAENGLICCENHQFDQAKQGYINLLLPQFKNSRNPGDDKGMVEARSRFLESGRYAPLSDALNYCVEKFWPDVNQWTDIGCGEGWYTSQIKEHLSDTNGYGVDISKFAIKSASKRNRMINWFVASANRLPFADQSLDAAVIMFAKIIPQELIRCLKPGAILITVGTAKDHLIELREFLYPRVKLTDFNARKILTSEFSELYNKDITFEWIPDSQQELEDLLHMTPHNWRASPQKKEAICEILNHPMTGNFRLQVWELDG